MYILSYHINVNYVIQPYALLYVHSNIIYIVYVIVYYIYIYLNCSINCKHYNHNYGTE